MEMKDITIIIPTRTNVNHIKAAIESIRSKKQYNDCKILVGADTPSKEVSEWIDANKEKLNFTGIIFVEEGKSRVGIVTMVENLIQKVDTKFVFYMHDDMIIGNYTLTNLLARWKPKLILSSRRIEPPIYPESVEKILLPLGVEPQEFNNDKFLLAEDEYRNKDRNVAVEGFFAPHFFAKEDWVGYDNTFIPQSREDSDLAMRFMERGYKLFTLWDSLVYHFSGKGSRKKDGVNKDSDEWKKSNTKNERNYIRKWYTLSHTPYILPFIAPKIPISAHVLVGKEETRMYDFLNNIEPYFDEIVFVFDKSNKDNSKAMIDKYVADTLANGPTNFSPDKFVYLERDLNNDFAAQTNYAIEHCKYEWTMKLDVDEIFPGEFLSALRFFIDDGIKRNPNLSVIGFPRINLLDGKVCNDIPRQHWFSKEFDMYPQRPENIQNPDIQFRLHKKNITWVNPVHEVPEPVARNDKEMFSVITNTNFFHPKDRQRQFQQEQKYQQINGVKKKEPINTIVYDSVIFTYEGITEHARQEVKELAKRGKRILLLDNNYRNQFGEEFKQFYAPVDFARDNYVTIINQPPNRWERSHMLKNAIGFLAFEGRLADDWVQIINNSKIKELWTPSNYCKELFIKSGVNKPVYVIPHGVDPNVWKPTKEKKFDTFTFLGAGTYHNSRKGLDLLARAFNEEFKKDEPVRLLFKVNKIYNQDESFNKYITQYISPTGNMNIEFIDEDMNESDMVKLFNQSQVFVSPHRSEGFGINILNALAVGLPVVVTNKTANMDFCTDKNSLFIETEEKDRWAPWMYPYMNAKWVEPKLDDLKKKLRKAYNDYEKLAERGLKQSEKIRTDWTWAKTVDKIEERLSFIN